MKRLQKLVRPALAGLLALIASGTVAAATPLRFVTHPLPPFSYEQNGKPAGPMVEILTQACGLLGIECQAQILPWRRALSQAEQGQVDGVFSVIDIPQRRERLFLLTPLLNVRYAFFASMSSGFNYTSPESLRGRRLAAYGPSGVSFALQEATKDLPGADITVTLDNVKALSMLAAGRFGAEGLVLANEDVAHQLIADTGLQGIRQAGVLKTLNYTFGLSRASGHISQDLVSRFDQALQKLCRDGVVSQIAIRHKLRAAPC